jgi:hypothetical protein
MNDHAGAKLLFANVGAWLGTIISLQNVQVVIAILSMMWLQKKLKSLEHGDKDEP